MSYSTKINPAEETKEKNLIYCFYTFIEAPQIRYMKSIYNTFFARTTY